MHILSWFLSSRFNSINLTNPGNPGRSPFNHLITDRWLRQFLALLICFLLYVIPSVAQTTEICNDGKDNNGDGKIDCADVLCMFAATIEKGCRCFDGIDNDGDGKIDSADPKCATYYGLTFVGTGSDSMA